MSFWMQFLIAFVGIGLFWWAVWLGYETGVRETERRWSEAITKAEADRNWKQV